VLVVVLLLTLLMSVLGAALALVTSSEVAIAANFRNSEEARYAVSAAAEHALAEMASSADWNQLLDGTVRSTLVDGPPFGVRVLADGSRVDLEKVLNLVNCQRTTVCGDAEMDAVTSDRPWGVNNPRWRLFAYGRLQDLLPGGTIDSPYYAVVLVADDPSETDGDPSRDGAPPDPGAGIVEARAHVFGPRGVRRTIDMTVSRTSAGPPRVMSWREIR
jgi:hypothetical protein